MTAQDSIIKIQEEYKKKEHGDFIKLLEKAFKEKLSPEDELALAKVARLRGWNLRWEHKFEDAVSCFSLALNVFEKQGDICEAYKLKKGKSICEGCLGSPQDAIAKFKGAVNDLRKLKKSGNHPKGFDPDEEMMKNYFYLSIVYAKDDNLKDAGKCLDMASEIVGENARFRGLILQGKAKLFHRKGNYESALDTLTRAGEVFASEGNEYKVMNVAEDAATNLHCLGRYVESIKEMGKVIEYYEKERIENHWAYFHRAVSLDKLNKHSDAKKDYIKAVETFEKLRGDIRTDHFRRSFSSSRMIIYERAIINALDVGEPERAYMLLQKAKARSFLEMLHNRQLYSFVPVNITRKLRDVSGHISGLLAEDERCEKDINIKKLNRLREEEAALMKEIERNAAANRKNISLEPVPVSEVMKNIPPGHLALDFFAVEDCIIMFFITHRDFGCLRTNIGEKELVEIIENIKGAVMDCGSTADETHILKEDALNWYMRKVTKKFPKKLMKELVPSCDTLIVVPHSYLHGFPFCLLTGSDGKYIAGCKRIFYLDNIQRIRKPSPARSETGNILIVSNPTGDLTFAQEESMHIRKIFSLKYRCASLTGRSSRVRTKDAFKKKLLRKLKDADIFHFAGHAKIDEKNPVMSRLLLPDSRLRVSEIFDIPLKCRLVFLNGCQTAKGKVLPGDEMNSFSRAFHFAGADEVIVNLWEVSDSQSPIMTKLFYESFSGGLPSESALQQAQKKAIAEGLSPFVWAAFKVIK